MHHRRVFKNAGVISLGIFLSRILGFIRDILIAAFLGTGPSAQAFFVAFRIPNLFRDIVAEGAANSSIIPVLAEYKKKGNFSEYRNVIFSLQFGMLSFLITLVTIGIFASPIIVLLIAPGFRSDPNLFSLTVKLARWLFPFLLFIGLFGLNMSILHTEERFFSTGLGQPLFNLSMIVCLLLWASRLADPVYSLVFGVWIGGFALIFAQIIDLNSLGYKAVSFRPIFHPAVKKMLALLGPRLIGTVIYHINIFADTILASLSSIVGPGGIAAIYYASRLMQFPLAIFSISVAQAVLPRLSHLNYNSPQDVNQTFRRSLELVMFLIVPSAAFLMRASHLIVLVLFERGAFGRYSVDITSAVLFYYAIGLVFFAGIKMLVSAFHSLQDTKTPVKTAAISLIVNVVLNIVLMFPMKIAGLALASTIAGGVNFVMLFWIMHKRIGLISRHLVVETVKIGLAGAVVYFILDWSMRTGYSPSIGFLFRSMVVAVGAYLIGCGLFRIDMWRSLVHWILEKVFGYGG